MKHSCFSYFVVRISVDSKGTNFRTVENSNDAFIIRNLRQFNSAKHP